MRAGFEKFRQSFGPVTEPLNEIAKKRGQADEYEALEALGFLPLGKFFFVQGHLSNKEPILLMKHSSLPVFAHLISISHKVLFVKFFTSDDQERILQTSSCSFSLDVKQEDYRATITEDADVLEDVFIEHISQLNTWEREGFQPARHDTLQDAARQSEIVANKAVTLETVKSNSIQSAMNGFLVSVILPVLFGSTLGAAIFKNANASTELIVNFTAAWSIVSSVVLFRSAYLLKGTLPEMGNTLPNSSQVYLAQEEEGLEENTEVERILVS